MTSVSGAGIEEDGKHSSVRSSYMEKADEEEAIPSGQVSCHLPWPVNLRALTTAHISPAALCHVVPAGLPRAALEQGQGISFSKCLRRLQK